jgi:hypothetical protein
MNLSEIKAAVLSGRKVHWKSCAYEITTDRHDQWLVVCRSTGGCWGLTWADNTTVNGKPDDFFVAQDLPAHQIQRKLPKTESNHASIALIRADPDRI